MKMRLCSKILCGLLDDIMGPELHVLCKIMEIRCMGGLYKAGFHLGFFVRGEELLGILDHTHFCRYCMLLYYFGILANGS